jgi:hypothetical protein
MADVKYDHWFWGAATTSVFDLEREDVLHVIGHPIADAMAAVEIHAVSVARLEVTEEKVRAFPSRPIPGIEHVDVLLPAGMCRALQDIEAGPPKKIPRAPLTLSAKERVRWEGLQALLGGASRLVGNVVYLCPFDFALLRKAAGDDFDRECNRELINAGILGTYYGWQIHVAREIPVGFVYTPPEVVSELGPDGLESGQVYRFDTAHLHQA